MQSNAVFSSLKQGVLICNADSRILYFNAAYEAYLGHPLSEVKGHRITRYRKNAQVPQVLASGQPLEGLLRREKNQLYYASIYPITEGTVITGTISLVTSLEQDHTRKSSRALTLAQRVREFEQQEILTAVAACGGGTEGKRKAAKELGISLATLYNKLKEEG